MNDTARKSEHILLKNLIHYIVRITGVLPGLLWLRPRILYENEAAKRRIRGGALLVSNHLSVLDPLYLMYVVWYRCQRFVCLKSFFDGKLKSAIFRIARCIPIDRENTGMDSMRQIVGALKAGELVTIFPEGHISETNGEMESFKSGAVLMAVLAGCPIVPIYIRKPKRRLSRLTACVGAPMDPTAELGRRPTAAQLGAYAEKLRSRELELEKISGGETL